MAIILPMVVKETAAGRRRREATGRAPKLTAELRQTLLGALRVGTPLKTALGFVGITDDVIYTWRNKAEAAKKIKNPSKDLQDLIAFFGEVDKAVNQANVSAQRTVAYLFTRPLESLTPEEQRIALQAAQFHLTHRDSKNYNTRSTTEITGADGGPLQVSGKMALELLRELASDDEG